MNNRQLRRRREQILGEIGQIHRLRQGQLSEQYYDRTGADGQVYRQGPYYVLQSWREGQKHSQRIASEQAAAVRADLKAYQRLRQLAQQFADVTEQLTCRDTAEESKKKPRKQRRSGTAKPKPSSM